MAIYQSCIEVRGADAELAELNHDSTLSATTSSPSSSTVTCTLGYPSHKVTLGPTSHSECELSVMKIPGSYYDGAFSEAYHELVPKSSPVGEYDRIGQYMLFRHNWQTNTMRVWRWRAVMKELLVWEFLSGLDEGGLSGTWSPHYMSIVHFISPASFVELASRRKHPTPPILP